VIDHSLIGSNAEVKRSAMDLSLGDFSTLND